MQSINGNQPGSSTLGKRKMTDLNDTNILGHEEIEPVIKEVKQSLDEKALSFSKGLQLKEEFENDDLIPNFEDKELILDNSHEISDLKNILISPKEEEKIKIEQNINSIKEVGPIFELKDLEKLPSFSEVLLEEDTFKTESLLGLSSQTEHEQLLLDAESINQDFSKKPGVGKAHSNDTLTYIFSAKGYSKLSEDEKKQICLATAIIQDAVNQAHQDFISNEFIYFQGSGAFQNWKDKCEETVIAPKSTEIGQMIEYRTMQILTSKLENSDEKKYLCGLGFEDQVTIPSSSYKKARPDIVLNIAEGKNAYIDITANSETSVGHILSKGKSKSGLQKTNTHIYDNGTLTNGAFLAETNYPTEGLSNLNLNPNILSKNMSKEDLEEIKVKLNMISELNREKEGLEIKIRDKINNVDKSVDKVYEVFVDPEFDSSQEEAFETTKAIYTLNGKQPNLGYKIAKGADDYKSSIYLLYQASDWVDNKPDWSKFITKPISELRTNLKQYIDTLNQINEIQKSI